jgi:hypothetical protein
MEGDGHTLYDAIPYNLTADNLRNSHENEAL